MAYVKKNLTPEQRSERARNAALSRKTHGGGRPKGSFTGPGGIPKMSIPKRAIQMMEEDYNVFRKLAFAHGSSLIDFMHIVATKLAASNQALLKDNVRI